MKHIAIAYFKIKFQYLSKGTHNSHEKHAILAWQLNLGYYKYAAGETITWPQSYNDDVIRIRNNYWK